MSEFNPPVPYVPAAVPLSMGPNAPKTIGQILDRTYRLMRSHFILLVGVAALPSALLLVMVATFEAVLWIPMIRQFPKPPDPQAMLHLFNPAIIIPVVVVFMVLNLAVFSIYLAAASYASTQADSGIKVTMRAAYGMAWQRAGRHVWLLVLIYLWAFLPLLLIEGAVVLVASLFAHSGATATPALFLLISLAVLLYIAACVYGMLMGLRLSLAYAACVEEDLTAYAAIKRSFQLTRGAKGRIFLVILVVYALLYAGILIAELAAVLLAVIGVLIAAVLHVHLQAPWSYVGIGVLGVIAFVVMTLFFSLSHAGVLTALGVVYNDQRLRKDGLSPAPLQAGGLA
jgi:hypothetical protein